MLRSQNIMQPRVLAFEFKILSEIKIRYRQRPNWT